jgi:stearoyl-CoA desaturase (delta-9 desaturase)
VICRKIDRDTQGDFMNAQTLKKLDLTNTLFLTITPILAIVLTITYFKTTTALIWPQILLAFVFYIITGMSITAGYHRLFSHRTYKAGPVLKFIYLIFGAAAFQNSALKWSADHRIHHNHVDHDKDPYNINTGFFFAHIGWIFYKEDPEKSKHFPKDLLLDKLVMWQHNHYMAIAIFMGLALPTIIGYFLGSALGGLALAGLFRIVFVHHCTFFINSLCHIVGKRTYTDTNSARDSFILAFFTYGEGYHNFHHYFPVDYRNGIKWYHFDPTKWLIKITEFIGLAKDLKKVPEKMINEAKDKMKRKTSFA